MSNICLMSDSYKYTHRRQYPRDTEAVYSYFESRGGKWPYSVFFGLQACMREYLAGNVVTEAKINDAEAIINAHMGPGTFDRPSWEYLIDQYGGKLPIRIKAVREGTCVPTNNVLLTVENTDPKCFWLTNFVETMLSRLWYPITVATQSHEIRKLMDWYMEETGVESDVYRLHDFGYRGVSSEESAGIGGAAHLLSFLGTDTVAALVFLRQYYAAEMPGFSIPASEHSTITSWGRDNEVEAMRNMLETWPTGIIACVSDSFDIYKACAEIWGTELKDTIMARDGTLVVRPDSGDPLEVVMSVLNTLGDKFGYSVNAKGYKVLDPHVRIIQGDGVDYDTINSVLGAMKHERWSIDNIAFGMGGALLQRLNRDTLKFAFKASAIKRDEKWYDVYKDPINASWKRSKAGRLKLIQSNGSFKTTRLEDNNELDCLQTAFLDGTVMRTQTLDQIRRELGTFP